MNKRTKFLSLFLVMVLSLSFLVACGKTEDDVEEEQEEIVVEEVEETEGPVTIIDDFDNEVVFEEPAKRIISLAPSNTEILFALGLDEEIVGVTSYCNYPEAAEEKEEIGSFVETNVEKVLELEPDLVFVSGEGKPEVMEQIEAAGIKVLRFYPQSIDAVMDTITALGQATGKNAEAEALVEEMTAHRDEILDKVKDAEGKRVFYEVWNDPLQTAGPNSFIGSLIEMAGGINIAADAEEPFPQFDEEALVENDPEVYLTADDGMKTVEDIEGRPGYEDITAIKEGQVILLEQDIISRAGPRVVDGLEIIAKAIYPELFE